MISQDVLQAIRLDFGHRVHSTGAAVTRPQTEDEVIYLGKAAIRAVIDWLLSAQHFDPAQVQRKLAAINGLRIETCLGQLNAWAVKAEAKPVLPLDRKPSHFGTARKRVPVMYFNFPALTWQSIPARPWIRLPMVSSIGPHSELLRVCRDGHGGDEAYLTLRSATVATAEEFKWLQAQPELFVQLWTMASVHELEAAIAIAGTIVASAKTT